jgi:hypothetical protein
MASTKNTGNEPVDAIDPGGTRPAKGGRKDQTEHTVESGDRNKHPDPHTKPES